MTPGVIPSRADGEESPDPGAGDPSTSLGMTRD
jgi:hypothetical protein